MISVIIPVYNRRAIVGRAIRSVLAQTHQDWELIVVDDGSTDGSGDYIAAEFGDRVRLLRQQRNRGVSAARNRAIAAAGGQWLAFLDSDDEWLPQKLDKQLEALATSGLQVCHTEEIWIRNGVRVNQHKHHQKYGGRIFLQALPLCVMSPSSIIIHRQIFQDIGLFDEALPACEDYELFLRLTCRYQVVFVDEPLIRKYGGHDDQLSRLHYAMDRFRIKGIDRILRQGAQWLSPDEKEAARALLVKKAKIVRNGARKRDNRALAAAMEEYLESWQGAAG